MAPVTALRRYTLLDAGATYRVFYRAVHEGAAAAYTDTERAAWAPGISPPDDWNALLGDELTWVALSGARIVGFATLGRDGHLDLLYVLPEVMRHGVAGVLYDRLEQEAHTLGLDKLETGASHLARPFLERRGWRVLTQASVMRHDTALTNFRMEKHLTPR